MRLDHLLSRESDILTRLDLDEMDRESEIQDCSILKALRQALRACLSPSKHKGKLTEMREHGGIAQMGEHLLCKQGVKGSNPFISAIRCFEIFSQGKISETSHPAERPTGREVGLTG